MFTTRPEIKGTFGVVSTTHWIAASVAMASLEKGGNAFDAASAAAFTLQVIEPNQNGLGGDVPIIFWSAERKRVEVICGQGPAPAGATIAHYRSLGLELVPGAGLLAAVVPGVFDGWMLLLRDHGTLHLRDVLVPAHRTVSLRDLYDGTTPGARVHPDYDLLRAPRGFLVPFSLAPRGLSARPPRPGADRGGDAHAPVARHAADG